MSKRSRYVCQACGTVSGKWSGKCDDCGAWNSIVEEIVPDVVGPKSTSAARGRVLKTESLAGKAPMLRRLVSDIREFDTVTGGGTVPGAAILVGGEPGIGKSTLLLQVVGQAALHEK